MSVVGGAWFSLARRRWIQDDERHAPIAATPEHKEHAMLSARNQFKGTVKSVKLGGIMAEVVVAVGDIEIVSAITRTSAEAMNLQPGNEVRAIIKSTEVIIDK
jgi:molybdopterin-binding protein